VLVLLIRKKNSVSAQKLLALPLLLIRRLRKILVHTNVVHKRKKIIARYFYRFFLTNFGSIDVRDLEAEMDTIGETHPLCGRCVLLYIFPILFFLYTWKGGFSSPNNK
jgi:hypothetical protein